uniref:Uncharacterized protein n=1 Tax=Arundo donax TaxID=35708 RepID=A0A0A9B8A3_ARUDO
MVLTSCFLELFDFSRTFTVQPQYRSSLLCVDIFKCPKLHQFCQYVNAADN